MGNTKYMMTVNNENKVTYLSRMGGGGACIARTKQTLIIAIWDKASFMSDNYQ